ncbi:MAG: hypothetical protein U0575_13030 [Phycisphaerales bacterium]
MLDHRGMIQVVARLGEVVERLACDRHGGATDESTGRGAVRARLGRLGVDIVRADRRDDGDEIPPAGGAQDESLGPQRGRLRRGEPRDRREGLAGDGAPFDGLAGVVVRAGEAEEKDGAKLLVAGRLADRGAAERFLPRDHGEDVATLRFERFGSTAEGRGALARRRCCARRRRPGACPGERRGACAHHHAETSNVVVQVVVQVALELLADAFAQVFDQVRDGPIERASEAHDQVELGHAAVGHEVARIPIKGVPKLPSGPSAVRGREGEHLLEPGVPGCCAGLGRSFRVQFRVEFRGQFKGQFRGESRTELRIRSPIWFPTRSWIQLRIEFRIQFRMQSRIGSGTWSCAGRRAALRIVFHIGLRSDHSCPPRPSARALETRGQGKFRSHVEAASNGPDDGAGGGCDPKPLQ